MSTLTASVLAPEDLLRAQYYGLFSRLLTAAPDVELLARLSQLGRDETLFGQALGHLAQVAAAASAEAVEDEFNTLFIGLGRGELLPYGSYYLTGFLHDAPLAALRQHLARLSVARADDIYEPEDHVAVLCEVMQGLIEGRFGAQADLASQREFFDAHMAPWLGRFFTDLESSAAARFYAPVGTLGRLFVSIEADQLRMLD